ncbi:MAG: DUF4870 domain-containing protein [Opitutales bacterium]
MENAPPPESQPGLNERDWITLIHASGLLAYISLPVVGPLVFWLIKRDSSAEVDYHGREALNFNLSMLIYSLAVGALAGLAFLLTFVIVGVLLWPVVWVLGIAIPVVHVVLCIIAAMESRKGIRYRYPLTFRLVNDSTMPRTPTGQPTLREWGPPR